MMRRLFLTLAPRAFCSGPPNRCDSCFITRTYSARATIEAAATTGSSSARGRIFSSKFLTSFFASSAGLAAVRNGPANPWHHSHQALMSAVACCPQQAVGWRRTHHSSLYFACRRNRFATARMFSDQVVELENLRVRQRCCPSRPLSHINGRLAGDDRGGQTGPKKSPLRLAARGFEPSGATLVIARRGARSPHLRC